MLLYAVLSTINFLLCQSCCYSYFVFEPIYCYWVVWKQSGAFITKTSIQGGGRVACALSSQLPKGFQQSNFKVQVRDGGGGHRVSDRLMHSSLTDGEIIGQCCRGEHSQSLGFRSPGGCMLIIIRYLTSSPWQEVHSVKRLRKRVSDTVIQVLERGAKAEDIGRAAWGPHRVLLGCTTPLGFERQEKRESGREGGRNHFRRPQSFQ